jgi:hypothetical protein
MTDVKARLNGVPWRLYKEIEVDGVKLAIRRPPPGVAVRVLADAREAGVVDAAGKPTDEVQAIRLVALVVATTLWAPDGTRPLYDRASPEDVAALESAPWLGDVQSDCLTALGSLGGAVEKLKGE